jgi:hypothetical protein
MERGQCRHVGTLYPPRLQTLIVQTRVGAVYGSRYSLWDISRLQGGKPMTGNSFPQGGHRFRYALWLDELFP